MFMTNRVRVSLENSLLCIPSEQRQFSAVCWGKGSFNNYVDKILPFFDPPPCLDSFDTLSKDTNRHFLTFSSHPSCPRSYWMTPNHGWAEESCQSLFWPGTKFLYIIPVCIYLGTFLPRYLPTPYVLHSSQPGECKRDGQPTNNASSYLWVQKF